MGSKMVILYAPLPAHGALRLSCKDSFAQGLILNAAHLAVLSAFTATILGPSLSIRTALVGSIHHYFFQAALHRANSEGLI